MDGGDGTARPAELKVTLGYLDGWEAEGLITYAGPRALARAQLAADIVTRRLERVHGISGSVLSVEFIGAGASFRGLSQAAEPFEVRLRVAGRVPSEELAVAIGAEVEALYTNGPAGCGGARTMVRESLGIKSCSLSRQVVDTVVIDSEALQAYRSQDEGINEPVKVDQTDGRGDLR